MDLWPAIDLRHGKVVRLLRGDDGARTEYGADPVAVARAFEAAGATRLHVVDLDAAFGEAPQRETIARLVAECGLEVELGGGLRDEAALRWALEGAGCLRAVVGSLASRQPELFATLTRRWPGRLVPALDAAGGAVRVDGWRAAGDPLAEAAARLRGLPCPAVLVTDVDRDGTGRGPNLELAQQVARESGLPALVSGGVGSLADLARCVGQEGIAGVVVGRAIYEGAVGVRAAVDTLRSLSHLAIRVIPCLDVAAGRVVKGVRFADLRDVGDPAEAAERYAAQGADEIVFLDVAAATENRSTALDWVRRTAERVFVPLTVGGGVRALADAAALFGAGADKVAINSAAVAGPELLTEVAERFGSQAVVLSIDARRSADRGFEVVTHGGQRGSGREAVAWAVAGVERGAGEILLTSIDEDGTREGYDLELIRAVAGAVRVPVIASGGAGCVDHLVAGLAAGAAAVLAASIFHERDLTVAAVKRQLAARGFRVRPSEEER